MKPKLRGSKRVTGGVWVVGALALLLVTESCGAGALVHARPDLGALEDDVNMVAAVPPRLGFGKLADQRRAGRRLGDFLIEATGGHAILADELPGNDPELVAAGIRSLGEEPRRTLVFSIIAARENRSESNAIPGAHLAAPVRYYSDYTVRLDVRSGESNEIIGSVETFSTLLGNAREIDSHGRPLGLARAIQDAVTEGVRKFAPRLAQPRGAKPRFAVLAEAPSRPGTEAMSGTLPAVDRLRRLQVLYPEVPETDLAALAASNARFLVISPGGLASLGLEARDLVSGTGGRSLGSRAAFARTLARGTVPALSVDRASGRFLIGQTVVAGSP